MRISDWSSDVCSSDLLAGQLTEGLSAGLEQLSARFAALENDGGARNQRLGDAISALTQEAERMEHALASGNVAADGLIGRAEALLLALDSGARELDETLPMSLSRLDERFEQTMRLSADASPEEDTPEDAPAALLGRV